MSILKQYAKLQAVYTQSVQAIAGRAHHRIFPHARLLVGIPLMGYPSTLQAFCLAPLSSQAPFIQDSCIDPRAESAHHSVLSTLENALVGYIHECQATHTAPQIWISNISAYHHWEALCDRLLYTQSHPKLCAILQYLTQRYHYGGAQSFLPLATVLKSHWVTGQPKFYDESLATWIQWLQPKVDLKSLSEAQKEYFYAPLNDNSYEHSPVHKEILPILKKETQRRLLQLRECLSLFHKRSPPLISHFSFWWEQELEYFSFFSKKEWDTTTDSYTLAAHKLEEREFSWENHLSDLRRNDPLVFYGQLLQGICIEGLVQYSNGKQLRLLSTQKVLRAREGDTLSIRKDPNLQFRLIDREIHPGGVLLHFEKTYGSFYIQSGRTLQLSPSSMGWAFKNRRRKNITQRIARRGWIHRGHEHQ